MVETAISYQYGMEEMDILIGEVRKYIDCLQYPDLTDHAWLKQMCSIGEELAGKLSGLASSLGETHATVYKSIKVLNERLRSFILKLAEHPNHQDLLDSRNLLARSYEEFLLELNKLCLAGAEALTRSRQLKPTNYARNFFHVTMGITGSTLYYFVLDRIQAVAILVAIFLVFGILEITRRFSGRWNDYLVDKVFGAIARPSERYRVNSSTFYVMALILIVLLLPKIPVIAATLVLALADPAASLIGKRWGHLKLFRDKTMAGSLAFFLVGFLVVASFLFMVASDLGIMRIAVTSLVIAFYGALTELLSSRIDDNFSVPIICAVVGTLMLI